MEINSVVIGQLVRNKRIEKNIGLRELAREVGVSPGYITQLEKGTYKKPSQTVLMKVFEILNFEKKYRTIFGLSNLTEKEIKEKVNNDELKNLHVSNLINQFETMEADELRKLILFLDQFRDIFTKIIEIEEKAHEKGKVIHSIREFLDFVHNKNVINRLNNLFE
jgi:transcriptional regulator with XRE-family HTH domain